MTAQGGCFKKDIQRAVKVFGADNVLILKSEDMLNEVQKPKIFQRLLIFLQLDGDRYQVESTKWLEDQLKSNYVVNAGAIKASKGDHTKILVNSSSLSVARKGLYEASNYQPMLPATRQLIHQRWRKECRYLRVKFGIQYSDC